VGHCPVPAGAIPGKPDVQRHLALPGAPAVDPPVGGQQVASCPLADGDDHLVAVHGRRASGDDEARTAQFIGRTGVDFGNSRRRDPVIAAECDRLPAQDEAHAFLFRTFDLFCDGRHVLSLAADDLHPGRAATQGAARAVHRRVAGADYHDLSLQGDRPALDAIEEVEALLDACEIFALDAEPQCGTQSGADDHGIEFLLQLRQRVLVQPAVALGFDAELHDACQVALQYLIRQAVGGNAVAQHTTGRRPGLVDRCRVPRECKQPGRGETRRATADHRNAATRNGG